MNHGHFFIVLDLMRQLAQVWVTWEVKNEIAGTEQWWHQVMDCIRLHFVQVEYGIWSVARACSDEPKNAPYPSLGINSDRWVVDTYLPKGGSQTPHCAQLNLPIPSGEPGSNLLHTKRSCPEPRIFRHCASRTPEPAHPFQWRKLVSIFLTWRTRSCCPPPRQSNLSEHSFRPEMLWQRAPRSCFTDVNLHFAKTGDITIGNPTWQRVREWHHTTRFRSSRCPRRIWKKCWNVDGSN